jgi:hypothetical protein
MNYGRSAIAAVAATVVYYAYGFVVEGLLIRKDFSPYTAVYRSADTVMGYMPLGLACTLIATFVITTLFANSYGGGTAGFGEVVRFGLLVGIFVACTFVGPNYVTLNIGRKLALELAASAIFQWMLVCLVIAFIYKPALVAAH